MGDIFYRLVWIYGCVVHRALNAIAWREEGPIILRHRIGERFAEQTSSCFLFFRSLKARWKSWGIGCEFTCLLLTPLLLLLLLLDAFFLV